MYKLIKKEPFMSGGFDSRELTPHYFIDGNGTEVFIQNVNLNKSIDVWEFENRVQNLEKNNFKYLTFHCPKRDINEFIEWVKENNYTLQIFGTLFERNDIYVDFHGNLWEYSSAFHFRIYDMDLARNIVKEVKSIKRKEYC